MFAFTMTRPTLKPRSGGREQLVTNLSRRDFSSVVKVFIILQNAWMQSCSALNSPEMDV